MKEIFVHLPTVVFWQNSSCTFCLLVPVTTFLHHHLLSFFPLPSSLPLFLSLFPTSFPQYDGWKLPCLCCWQLSRSCTRHIRAPNRTARFVAYCTIVHSASSLSCRSFLPQRMRSCRPVPRCPTFLCISRQPLTCQLALCCSVRLVSYPFPSLPTAGSSSLGVKKILSSVCCASKLSPHSSSRLTSSCSRFSFL